VKFRQLICLASLLAANVYLNAQRDGHTGIAMPADSAERDTAAIIALEQRDAAAAKINDVETLVSLWTEDGVLLQPRTEPVVGISAIRQLLDAQKQQSAMIQMLSYEENWKERRILGNEAYEWGEISMTARLPNGKEAAQTVLAMRVLRRQQDGSWKFARAAITQGPPKS